jgi:hypothetical protein
MEVMARSWRKAHADSDAPAKVLCVEWGGMLAIETECSRRIEKGI